MVGGGGGESGKQFTTTNKSLMLGMYLCNGELGKQVYHLYLNEVHTYRVTQLLHKMHTQNNQNMPVPALWIQIH